jgi:hypothetical protein
LNVPGFLSWSWISIGGEIHCHTSVAVNTTFLPDLELLDIDIRWKGLAMSSQLLGASLLIRGRLKQFKLRKARGHNGRTDNLFEIYSAETENIYCGLCNMDTEDNCTEPLIWCLEVVTESHGEGMIEALRYDHQVLVLRQSVEHTKAFIRIGMGHVMKVSYREGGRISDSGDTTYGVAGKSFDNVEVQEIFLV